MTVTPFDIYLISLADDIIKLSRGGVTLFLFAFAICMLTLFVGSVSHNEETRFKKCARVTGIMLAVSVALNTFTPTSKTIAAMYLIPAIVNNEHLQNSANNALGALEELTKQWLKDMMKEKDGRQKETNI